MLLKRHQWSVVDQPAGAKVSISDPAKLKSAVSFDAVGDYTLALRASDSNGVSVDTVKVVIYPPHRREAPARYAQNHQVFTPKSELYSDEFIAKHFPEFPTKLVTQKDRNLLLTWGPPFSLFTLRNAEGCR